MFNRHPAEQASRETALYEAVGSSCRTVPARACCCPAKPVVKVSMPPAPGRPHTVDLWLCGHHYRSSWAALDAANAVVDFVADLRDEFLPEPAATV